MSEQDFSQFGRNADFIPNLSFTGNGTPVRRTYWSLPVTTVPRNAISGKPPSQVIGELLDKNIQALDEAFGDYAREQIVLDTDGNRFTAQLGAQAIQILKEFREVLLAINLQPG